MTATFLNVTGMVIAFARYIMQTLDYRAIALPSIALSYNYCEDFEAPHDKSVVGSGLHLQTYQPLPSANQHVKHGDVTTQSNMFDMNSDWHC
jgi:hypothetical protein